jgi:hypothetical protein
MASEQTRDSLPEPVDVARTRRAELLAAINALECSLAVPARNPDWASGVASGLATLEAAFDGHIHATEGNAGVYSEILATAPRFRFAIDQLIVEHGEIRANIRTMAKLIDSLDPTDHETVEHIRDDGTTLLSRLVRHRQRGADLVFEAYEQDIGGCD